MKNNILYIFKILKGDQVKLNSQTSLKRSILFCICFAAVLMIFAVLPVQAQQPLVSITAPEWVEGTTGYALVEITNVMNLDAGQFDLSFNSNILKVASVEDGDIEGTKIPIQWRSIDADTIRVIFNLKGVTGINGSGQLAKIGFEVIGDGDSTLDISNELLGDTQANKISADWGVNAEADAHRSTPGFGAVFALVSLIAVFSWVKFSKRS